MNEEIINASPIKQTLGGSFKIAIVDAESNNVIWQQDEWQKNLILNNGLNQVVSTTYANMIYAGILGTGTRVNSVYANAGTVSQSGTTITLVPDPSFVSFTSSLGGYSAVLEAGDVIVFDTGSGGVNHVLVSSGISNTTATAISSLSIPSTTFTIWKTSQTSLQSEMKRASATVAGTTVVSGIGNCGTTIAGNVVTMLKTWDFTSETSSVNYTEVGIGWADTGATTFSRLLLPSPITIAPSQKLRLSYQLQISIFPTASIARPDATINGWTVTSPSGSTTMASESVQNFLLGSPDGSGNYAGYPCITYINYAGSAGGYATIEPSSIGDACSYFISPVTTSFSAFNTTAKDRSANSTIIGYGGEGGTTTYKNSYVTNTFTINKTATFGLYGANRNDLACIGFGYTSYFVGSFYSRSDTNTAFCMIFNKPQTKYNTQTLTVSFVWAWDRSFIA